MMATLQSMMARYGVISTTMILLQKEYAELQRRAWDGMLQTFQFSLGTTFAGKDEYQKRLAITKHIN